MKECVIIDGVRTANARAHEEKGWFRNLTPDVLLTSCYEALFQRNSKIKPEDIEAVFAAQPTSLASKTTSPGWDGWPEGSQNPCPRTV